jgi:hypothetical protein
MTLEIQVLTFDKRAAGYMGTQPSLIVRSQILGGCKYNYHTTTTAL